MKTRSKLLVASLTAIGIGMAASSAILASPYGYGQGECLKGDGYGPGYGMKGGPGSRQGGPGMFQGRYQRGDMVGRLETIKDELKITEVQEPAWDKFISAMQAHRESRIEKMQARRSGDNLEDIRLSASERLDKRVEWMSEGLEQMREMKKEFDALYKVLDAEQRELVDRVAFMRHRGYHGF